MEIGFVGLGRMGLNMVTRLRRGGHRVGVRPFVRGNRPSRRRRRGRGRFASDLAGKLSAPRAVWVMVPAGAPTESTVTARRFAVRG
jgi:6-phosphogluconate dehydrogenase